MVRGKPGAKQPVQECAKHEPIPEAKSYLILLSKKKYEQERRKRVTAPGRACWVNRKAKQEKKRACGEKVRVLQEKWSCRPGHGETERRKTTNIQKKTGKMKLQLQKTPTLTANFRAIETQNTKDRGPENSCSTRLWEKSRKENHPEQSKLRQSLWVGR